MEKDKIIRIIRDEWRSLHSRLYHRAARLKQQQWWVVLFGSLLFAGIIAFMHTQGLGSLGGGERWFVRALSLTVLGCGIFLLSLLQYNLRNTRKRLQEIEDSFLIRRKYANRLNSWERMQKWGGPKYLYQFPYYILFMLALLLGFMFVHWYLRSDFIIAMYIRFIPH
jgi:hypothetical protein